MNSKTELSDGSVLGWILHLAGKDREDNASVRHLPSLEGTSIPACCSPPFLTLLLWAWSIVVMLTDKVAVVTGAAQGIGLATARLMLYHGAKVTVHANTVHFHVYFLLQVSLADINETAGEATCSSLKRDFGRDVAIFTHTDVTDSNQLVSCTILARARYYVCL